MTFFFDSHVNVCYYPCIRFPLIQQLRIALKHKIFPFYGLMVEFEQKDREKAKSGHWDKHVVNIGLLNVKVSIVGNSKISNFIGELKIYMS